MALRAIAFVCSCLIFTSLVAEAEEQKLFPAEAAIPNSRIIHFTSAIDKEPYTLQISIPIFEPRPKSGYPVIYVLDGELYFPVAAIASDFLGDKSAVVVGIGHEALNDKAVITRYARHRTGANKAADGPMALNAFQTMRDYDFKWPVRPEHRAPAFVENFIGPETGDVDTFLQVIEKEIKPKVAALISIDKGNQALFGHSAGGLAVVRALFTEPNAFRSFIAASPSLWYDGALYFRAKTGSLPPSLADAPRHACWSQSAPWSRTTLDRTKKTWPNTRPNSAQQSNPMARCWPVGRAW